MIDTGDLAPDFALVSDDGGEITLSALRPAPVVVYFYPRDDTSGCTKEALEFTDLIDRFEAAGAHVLGISADTVAKHEKFRDKHGLKVTLLSDPEATTCALYDVWKEKSMYGKTFMGIERSTFVIDGEGRIARAWRKVKVPGHAEEVLTTVEALSR